MQRPQEHASYKHLFQQQWSNELRRNLNGFLQELMSSEQQTVIEQMYQKYSEQEEEKEQQGNRNTTMVSQSNNQEYTQQLELNNQELLAVIQDYNLKYNQMQKKFKEFIDQSKQAVLEAQEKWYNQCKDIIHIAKDIHTQPDPDRKKDLLKKLLKYDKLYSYPLDHIISQNQDLSVFDKASMIDNELSISPIQPAGQHFNFNKSNLVKAEFAQLDFQKIHQMMIRSDQDLRTLCNVLQALRWRITKAKTAYLRREVLIQY